jgi:hypothetical protein
MCDLRQNIGDDEEIWQRSSTVPFPPVRVKHSWPQATLLIVTLAEYRITPAFLTLNLNALRNALSLTVLFTCHSLPTPATKSLIPPLLSNTWKNQSDRSTSQNRMRLLC